MTDVVRAADAAPGYYRSARGTHVVCVVARSHVSRRWPPPPGGPASCFVPYRFDSKVFGGEVCGWLPLEYPLVPCDPPAERVAEVAERAERLRTNLARAPRPPKARDPRLPAPGTILRRKFKGVLYEVTVLEDGVEYQGERFGTISAAGARIIGGSCNGYAFFGLGGRARAREEGLARKREHHKREHHWTPATPTNARRA